MQVQVRKLAMLLLHRFMPIAFAALADLSFALVLIPQGVQTHRRRKFGLWLHDHSPFLC
jgi:hypothetical protein